MKYVTQTTTLMGTVTDVNSGEASFTIRCRSGDIFPIHANSQTVFGVLTNLDDLNRDRVPSPPNFNPGGGPPEMVRKYLQVDALVVVAPGRRSVGRAGPRIPNAQRAVEVGGG